MEVIERNKARFRQEALQRRDALSPDVRKRKSSRIIHRLTSLPAVSECRVIMAYMSMRSEVDTRELLTWAWGQGKTLALPITLSKERRLLPAAVADFSQLRLGTFGIMEPDLSLGAKEVDPALIDVVVVPGAAFDSRGYRIGYGGGYYDRFLLETRCLKFGVAFAEQLYPMLPAARHDVPVDFVVTDESVIDCRFRSDLA